MRARPSRTLPQFTDRRCPPRIERRPVVLASPMANALSTPARLVRHIKTVMSRKPVERELQHDPLRPAVGFLGVFQPLQLAQISMSTPASSGPALSPVSAPGDDLEPQIVAAFTRPADSNRPLEPLSTARASSRATKSARSIAPGACLPLNPCAAAAPAPAAAHERLADQDMRIKLPKAAC